MAFVVEDGTGLSTATSYISDTDADTYLTQYGSVPTEWSGALASAKQAALNTATRYIDATWQLDWRGVRATQAQSLSWPRGSVIDDDGYPIAINVVPSVIVNITAILAAEHLVLAALTPAVPLLANLASPGVIKREYRKLDALEKETEYAGGGATPIRRFMLVERMVKALLRGRCSPVAHSRFRNY